VIEGVGKGAQKSLIFLGGEGMCSQVGHTASAPICQGTEAPKEAGYSKERQAESKFGGLWRGAPPGAMSTYLLNCHGLGNIATVRELRDFACELAPSILCVVETQVHKSREMQVHKSRVECLAGTLGYDNVFVVSSTCHSGGLGIFSNNEIKLDLLPYS
jgi:hypothetical protein